MPADEDGSLRRRLAEQALATIEWGAEGTFTLRLHTHPASEPCREAAHPPGDQPDRAREHGPHYCAGCGTVWYTRTPQAVRCPICGSRTASAAAGAPGDPAAGIIQWHDTGPSVLACAAGMAEPGSLYEAASQLAGPAEAGDYAESGGDSSYASGGLVPGPLTWADDAQGTHLAVLLEEMCCGDPAETARAFYRRHMVFGRDARLLVYHVAEAVTAGQPVGLHPDGGVRPWPGGPGAAPHGIALMAAPAGSLAVVAVPDETLAIARAQIAAGPVTAAEIPDGAGYQVPDDAQVTIPLDQASPENLAAALGLPACPCGCGYGGDNPHVTPDAATREHAELYGEDADENAAELARQPGDLERMHDSEPLLMAAVPGPEYFAWRHAGTGIWVARPGAATADVPPSDPAAAVLTTVADVRTLLHAKGETAR